MVSIVNINYGTKEPTRLLSKLQYQSNIDSWWVSLSERIFVYPSYYLGQYHYKICWSYRKLCLAWYIDPNDIKPKLGKHVKINIAFWYQESWNSHYYYYKYLNGIKIGVSSPTLVGTKKCVMIRRLVTLAFKGLDLFNKLCLGANISLELSIKKTMMTSMKLWCDLLVDSDRVLSHKVIIFDIHTN
jgi:hypothetical protein